MTRFSFDRLLTTLLFVTISLAAALMPAQNDTFWQLRAGHDMWHARAVLLHDTFSHTAYGSAWPNHEWLSQVVLYASYAAGGLILVTLTAAAAIVGAWWIIWAITPASARTRFLLIALVVVSACGTWSPRPQVFSLLLLAATVALLRARPRPSEAEVRAALSHNLCRCGAHVEILQAVRLAAGRIAR